MNRPQNNFNLSPTLKIVVIDRYGNFHLTATDMLILIELIPIRRKRIHRYRCQYEKLLDTDTDTIIF